MKPSPLSSLILATLTAGTLNAAKASDCYGRIQENPGPQDIRLHQIISGLITSGGHGPRYPQYSQAAPCESYPAPKKRYHHRPNAWKIVGGQFSRGRTIPQGWHSIGWFQSRGLDVNRLILVNEDGQYYRGNGPSSCASHEHGGNDHHYGQNHGGSGGGCASGANFHGGGYGPSQGGCLH